MPRTGLVETLLALLSLLLCGHLLFWKYSPLRNWNLKLKLPLRNGAHGPQALRHTAFLFLAHPSSGPSSLFFPSVFMELVYLTSWPLRTLLPHDNLTPHTTKAMLIFSALSWKSLNTSEVLTWLPRSHSDRCPHAPVSLLQNSWSIRFQLSEECLLGAG